MRAQLTILLTLLSLVAGLRADTFFVANQGVNSVTKYDSSGSGASFTDASLTGPTGVALDHAGNLFVATANNTIEKFSESGVHLGTFATTGVNNPMALAFDRIGNLYVANFGGNTVEKFSISGVATLFANIARPTGLAFDAAGNLYVATFNNTVERYALDGAYLGTFASTGMSNPEGLAFDSLGNLYAANNTSNTVEKFSSSGVALGAVAVNLNGPVGLAFDSSGSLYIVNSLGATITKVDESGQASTFASTSFNPQFIAAQTSPHLVNISTRAQVLTGDNVLDAGFIIRGPGTKQILIRGLGPSLAGAGVSGVLADPIIELQDSTGAVIAINNDWKQTQEAAIEATGIPPNDDNESAIVQTLSEGAYTVIERGSNNGTGIGLVEVYDLALGFGPSFANISTRGYVGANNNVMIAGLIVGATSGGTTNVLLRALGPSLGSEGVSGALANPVLDLYDANGNHLANNDNWQSSQASEISATGIPPNNPLEAAIVATLLPGNYTAIESGKDGTTGVGLVEVYDLP